MDGHDELAESAAREQADRLVARGRLRTRLLSIGASAGVVLLALTAVSLLRAAAHRNDARTTGPTDILVIQQRGHEPTRGEAELSAIEPPPGWTASPPHRASPPPPNQPASWTTTWTIHSGDTGTRAAVVATLTAAQWQPCLGPADAPDACWQKFPYLLIVNWSGCPATGPCREVSITLIDPFS